MLCAGSMNKRITIQRLAVTEDGEWGSTTAWSDHLTRWANVQPMSANERMRNQGPSSEATYVIRMRYLSDFTGEDRISWNNKIFDIVGIINVDERNAELEVMAKVHDESGAA